MFKVSWDHQEIELDSVNELDELLDRLHQECDGENSLLVNIELAQTGDSLSVGIGRELSVLNYVSGSQDPPYFTSVGGSAGPDEVLVFRFMGEWSEFSLRNAIPLDVARAAVRHFCNTGELSKEVRWEQD